MSSQLPHPYRRHAQGQPLNIPEHLLPQVMFDRPENPQTPEPSAAPSKYTQNPQYGALHHRERPKPPPLDPEQTYYPDQQYTQNPFANPSGQRPPYPSSPSTSQTPYPVLEFREPSQFQAPLQSPPHQPSAPKPPIAQPQQTPHSPMQQTNSYLSQSSHQFNVLARPPPDSSEIAYNQQRNTSALSLTYNSKRTNGQGPQDYTKYNGTGYQGNAPYQPASNFQPGPNQRMKNFRTAVLPRVQTQTLPEGRRVASSPNLPQVNGFESGNVSPVIQRPDSRTKSLSSASKFTNQPMQPIQQRQSLQSTPPLTLGNRTSVGNNSSSSMHHTFSLSSKSRSFTSLSKLSSSLSTKKFSSSTSLQGKNIDRTVSSSTLMSQKTISRKPAVYPAMLSRVARLFKESIPLTINTKDGLEYHDTFTGKMAVDIICRIIRTNDRNLALLLGRSLDAQKLFHDVTYIHRLRDSVHEVYAFNHVYTDVELYEENNSERNSSADLRFIAQQQVLQQQLPSHYNSTSIPPSPSLPDNPTFDEQLKQEDSSASTGVNGVFTILTDCYSPTCSRNRLCYSIACPRRLEQQARLNLKPQGGLKRAVSRLSLHDSDESKSLWHETVPNSVLDKLDKREKMRQELIYEFIYTERDYVKDLEFMTDFYILPLRNPANNIIPEREREAFIRTVFGGVSELLRLAKSMSEALTRRQQQQKPVISTFADVFLQFVDRFDPFIKYSGNKVFASFEHERQQQVNMRYASFLDAIEKRPESRKQNLSSFLIKGVQRPARYQLLLGGILKNTDEDAPDYKNLLKAKEEIEKILVQMNIQTGESTDRHKIMVLHRLLGKRTLEERFNFKLSYTNRIIYQVTLSRKRDNEKIDLYLFEHSLLLVKHKIQNKREQYKVFEKPIFLPLLYVNSGYDIPTFRNVFASRLNGSVISDSGSKVKVDTAIPNNTKFQINLLGLGSQQVHTTLYADDITTQNQVLNQISQQQKLLIEKHDIFSLSKFETRRFTGNNRINCAVPCYGGKKLLYGTDSGVWVSTVRTISITKNEKVCSDPTLVLSKLYVTQIEVLVEYSKLLVLSDKSLYEFDLSCTDSLDHIKNTRSGKLILTHVNSFKTGICDGRLLVCATKTGNMHSINIFEPSNPFDKSKNRNKKYEIREINFTSDPISISFLRTKLCIGCTKGFEILSLEEGKKEPILDEADPSLDFATQRESVTPLAIHKLGKDFLLSYSEFSFLINRNGWRTKHDWGIFWEGNPTNIALFYPYILSFEQNFIEIRDLESTNLNRALVGENIRFLHSNEHEAMYACEENGYDIIVSIDFLNLKPKSS